MLAVSRSHRHTFSKPTQASIRLVAGEGVEGDAHRGVTVQHRSRVARDPTQPNLRQVHLLHAELFDELYAAGYVVGPGDLGENITTVGLDVLGLPTGSRLRIGQQAVVEVTGLRNPCRQIDEFQPGLLQQVVSRHPTGEVVRRTGVMGVVLAAGRVEPGDRVDVTVPHGPRRPLAVV